MKSRPVGAGGAMAPPYYDIWADQLNLSISTRGADYAHHIITTVPPPGFSDLPTALISGECPSCLEGEVKPLRAERKLTAAVTKVQAKTSHFEVF